MRSGKQGSKRASDVFKAIDPDIIDPPSEVARLEIPEGEIKELAKSIKEQGQLQNILVFKKNDRYEIVAGHRRWLAIRYLKQKTISCKVVDSSPEMNALARASENLQRTDLTPLEEGMIYQGLIEQFDMAIDQIAKITGISAGIVKRRINILKMPDSLIDAVHKRLISQTIAEELMRCPDEEYRDYLIQMSRDHGVTKDVARQWVDDRIKELRTVKSASARASHTPDVYIDTPVFVACQGCKLPKDIKDLRSVGICPDCFKIFITMLEGGAFKKGGD
ncbi:Nucleoid occlusion protein [subsurface metagenome]